MRRCPRLAKMFIENGAAGIHIEEGVKVESPEMAKTRAVLMLDNELNG